jgi:hypothetical protein
MARILIRRDQFNITPQGITHKPTDASFVPQFGDHHSGSMRLGQLGSVTSTGDNYDPDEDDEAALGRVCRGQFGSVQRQRKDHAGTLHQWVGLKSNPAAWPEELNDLNE